MSATGRLGSPEVWRLEVQRGSLVFGLLQPDGTRAFPRSAAIPVLTRDDIPGQLRLAEQTVWSRWCAQLDEWVRGASLARLGEPERQPER
jgi:hypothetical protein